MAAGWPTNRTKQETVVFGCSLIRVRVLSIQSLVVPNRSGRRTGKNCFTTTVWQCDDRPLYSAIHAARIDFESQPSRRDRREEKHPNAQAKKSKTSVRSTRRCLSLGLRLQ